MEGHCHYCGEYRHLSKEHVPPKTAFNSGQFSVMSGPSVLNRGPDDRAQGKNFQNGVYVQTVCTRCNNNTGGWYAKAYALWCQQGAEHLVQTSGAPTVFRFYYLQPLRVIKQIVAMFLAINTVGFGDSNEYLRRFIANPRQKGLPPEIQVYAYLCSGDTSRSMGLSCQGDMASANVVFLSELSAFPFGYVITFDSKSPDHRLRNITHFSTYGFNDYIGSGIDFRNLPINLAMPADYRTKEQILEEAKANAECNDLDDYFLTPERIDDFRNKMAKCIGKLQNMGAPAN